MLDCVDTVLGTCGSIDERGFINSFDRKGFTHKKGGSELLSNSHDCGSTRVFINVCRDKIKLIDNGKGMDITRLNHMFDMFRENHAGDKSMGVSGVGAKPSLYLLSKLHGNPTQVAVLTRTEDGDYLKAIVPFDKMKEQGKYTGMIKQIAMTREEIDEFNADRSEPMGTTIELKYSLTTHECFEKQFSSERKTMDLSDRFDCIFGKTSMDISYRDYESASVQQLPLYDYFSGSRPDYYAGIKEDIIEHWLDKNKRDRFVWENSGVEYEFTPKLKNISKILEPVQSKAGWTNIGFYIIKNGMRRDVRWFDEQNPIKTVEEDKKGKRKVGYGDPSRRLSLCEYDENFFEGGKDELKMTVAKLSIIRNEQYISSIELDDYKISSARGNWDGFMKTVLHRTELSYCTESCHDNRMDMAIGIQENKNQHVASDIPANLTRLIEHIKKQHFAKVIDYFELKCKEINNENEELEKLRQEELERIKQEAIENAKQEELERLKQEAIENAKQEKARQEAIEKARQEELERIKQEAIENAKQEELENAELERLKQEELENANLEKVRQEELERLKQEELENAKQANLEELEKLKQEEIEKARQAELENSELEAKQRKVSEMFQTRMTVANGIKALTHIKQENLTDHHDLINDMLISYSDRCAPDQLKQYILALSFAQRIDILLVLIDEKYCGNNEADMKEGAKLFRAMN
jgi:hypothetical protein